MIYLSEGASAAPELVIVIEAKLRRAFTGPWGSCLQLPFLLKSWIKSPRVLFELYFFGATICLWLLYLDFWGFDSFTVIESSWSFWFCSSSSLERKGLQTSSLPSSISSEVPVFYGAFCSRADPYVDMCDSSLIVFYLDPSSSLVLELDSCAISVTCSGIDSSIGDLSPSRRARIMSSGVWHSLPGDWFNFAESICMLSPLSLPKRRLWRLLATELRRPYFKGELIEFVPPDERDIGDAESLVDMRRTKGFGLLKFTEKVARRYNWLSFSLSSIFSSSAFHFYSEVWLFSSPSSSQREECAEWEQTECDRLIAKSLSSSSPPFLAFLRDLNFTALFLTGLHAASNEEPIELNILLTSSYLGLNIEDCLLMNPGVLGGEGLIEAVFTSGLCPFCCCCVVYVWFYLSAAALSTSLGSVLTYTRLIKFPVDPSFVIVAFTVFISENLCLGFSAIELKRDPY